ncbi:MAG TPA: diaminopimelate epimerase [Bacteroidales bacterium]|nr:diaminopimelate epimerase [Bacteroidales bacterium]
MTILFEKYHGAGNDFIMIDGRDTPESFFTTDIIKYLCDRHFGVGADGLILLLEDPSADFRMKYFNSDGREGTMCGNGGRCIVAFASSKGLINSETTFAGIDGLHQAVIKDNGLVSLHISDVDGVQKLSDGYLLNTGSKHFVTFRDDIGNIDVFREGRALRYESRFSSDGANINFIRMEGKQEITIRTYERGVEDETMACGTGSVASAITAYIHTGTDRSSFTLHAPGGQLSVSFNPVGDGAFTDIWLEGPVKYVFSGEIDI